jgi:nickel transport protein
MRKQFIIFFLFFSCWGLFYAVPAQAHRVNVFAWVEGNTVYTTAKFSGGKVARESLVEVYDSQKKLLLKGKTDNKGDFSFSVPKIDNLDIVVYAGTGHRGSWQVKKSELTSVSKTAAPENVDTSHKPAAQNPTPAAAQTSGAVTTSSPNLQINSEEIEKIVQKVVNRSLTEKLHPLMLMLAEIRDPDPGLKDILGGLGYILGLVGIIAYIKSRKQPSPTNRDL